MPQKIRSPALHMVKISLLAALGISILLAVVTYLLLPVILNPSSIGGTISTPQVQQAASSLQSSAYQAMNLLWLVPAALAGASFFVGVPFYAVERAFGLERVYGREWVLKQVRQQKI